MVRQKWGGWMSLNNDLLGCIDHLGISLTDKPWFVQTTVGSAIGEKKREIMSLPWNLKHCHVEIWRGVGGKKGQVFDHRFKDKVELDRWFFQRYRMENEFRLIKGDVIKIPPEVLAAVFSRKKNFPLCACGAPMKKELEQQVGRCGDCIRKGVGVTPPPAIKKIGELYDQA